MMSSIRFFFTIPLGDNDRFRIKEYEIDVTHVTKKDEQWWLELFNKNPFIHKVILDKRLPRYNLIYLYIVTF